jgi:hypothetical protein
MTRHMENNHRTNMEKNLLAYTGQLNSEVRVRLIDLVHWVALTNLGPRSDLKKLVSVALELLDNAQRHSAANDVDFHWSIVGNELVVSISNQALQGDALRLAEQVRDIAAMTKEEIAENFKQQLMDHGFGEHGGAGLGLLQIARKVGNRIDAEITDDGHGTYRCTSTVATLLTPAERNSR